MRTPASNPDFRQSSSQRLLITVHGIRTFGHWQEKLEKKLPVEILGNTHVCHYRYGFFTILAFLIPPIRWLATRRFRSELLKLGTSRWSRIDIVAHSFGTHLVGWGVLGLPKSAQFSVNTVIFAGSVLKTSFPVREFMTAGVQRLVNDCGISDTVLLLNQILVLFTGMAGRVGMSGMENNSFRNRYFNFGHGGYFKEGRFGQPDFMDKFWIPLLRPASEILPHDERMPNRLYDLTTLLLNNAEPVKITCYVLPLLLLLGYVNSLRLDARTQASLALSRQLAAQSDLMQRQDTNLEPAVLLAAESLDRAPSTEVRLDRTFRSAAGLLARQIWMDKLGGAVYATVFSPQGHYLASGSDDGNVTIFEGVTGRQVSRAQLGDVVLHAVFSPEGKYLAAGTVDTVTVIESATGKQVFRLIRQGRAVDFSPDGHLLVTGSMDGTVRVFDTASWSEVSRLAEQGQIYAVAFSGDGHLVASGSSDHTARVIEATTGREISRLTLHDEVWAVAFSRNGLYVATGDDSTVRVFEAKTGRELSRLNIPDDLLAIAFSPDDENIAIAVNDSTARVFETQSGTEVSRLTEKDRVNSVSFSPDGRYVATGSDDGTARVFYAETGEEVTRLFEEAEVKAVAFSPNGRDIAMGSEDHTVRVFESSGDREIWGLPLKDVDGVTFSDNGRYVAVAGDSSVLVFEVDSGRELSRFPKKGGRTVLAFGQQDRYLAMGNNVDSTARVFDLSTGKEILGIVFSDAVSALAWSADGRYLAASSFGRDHTTHVIEIPSGRETSKVELSAFAFTLALSKDGHYLAAGCKDNIVRIFDLSNGKEITQLHLPAMRLVLFSPDGRLLAGNDTNTGFFEVASGKQVSRFSLSSWASAASFTIDGRYVIIGTYGKGARVFEADTGKELVDLPFEGNISAVHFAARPKSFLTASGDPGMVTISNDLLTYEDLIRDACSKLTRNLSSDEWQQYVGNEMPYHTTCKNLP